MGNCTKGEEKAKPPQPVVEDEPTKQQQDEQNQQQKQEQQNLEASSSNNVENKPEENNDGNDKNKPPVADAAATSVIATDDENKQDQSSIDNTNTVGGGAVTSPFRNRPMEHVDDENDENDDTVDQSKGDASSSLSGKTKKDKLINNTTRRIHQPTEELTVEDHHQTTAIITPVASNFDFKLTPFQRNKSLESSITPETIEGGIDRAQVFSCFEGGLLYRIVGETSSSKKKESNNRQHRLPKSLRSQSWFFYNDTLDLDMKIEYSFGPTSRIEFGADVVVVDKTDQAEEKKTDDVEETEEGENKDVKKNSNHSNNWTRCSLIVKPGETKLFITGVPNGYKSSYSSSINENFFVVSPTSRDEDENENREAENHTPAMISPLPGRSQNKKPLSLEEELEAARMSLVSSSTPNKTNDNHQKLIQQFVEESVSRARNRKNQSTHQQVQPFLSPTRIYGEDTFCLLPSQQRDRRRSDINEIRDNNDEPVEVSIRRALHHSQLQFVDLQFPPSDESLFRPEDGTEEEEDDHDEDENKRTATKEDDLGRGGLPSLSWSRVKIPKEGLGRQVVNNETSVHPSKIDAGVLGDLWLTSALITLADAFPKMIEERMFVKNSTSTIDGDNDDNDDDMVQVSINKAGWWRDVIVDNFLPMSMSRPAFARPRRLSLSNTPEDYWVSFAQKAMAKVHGSYGSLIGGDVLHALQDLSGYPTTNLNDLWCDVSFSSSSSSCFEKEKYLFDRLSRSVSQGHIVMLTTPGLDEEILEEVMTEKFAKIHPEIVPGETSAEDFVEFYRERFGLGLGVAYSVKYVYTDKNVTLLQLLNCSGDSELNWKGDWSWGSELWKKYPNVERACRAVNHHQDHRQPGKEGKQDGDTSKSSTYFWISWDDCKKFFSECGICYVQRYAYETRVVGYFGQDEPRVPSVVLELKNSSSTNNKNSKLAGSAKNNSNNITAMLSQVDSRGLRSDHPQAHGAAMLLSLFGNDEDEDGWYRLRANSTQDIEKQTTDKFEYTFIRDISMNFDLNQNNNSSASYLVPRIHEKSRQQDTFFCVSIFSSEPLEIKFRSLSGDCSVFKNAKAVSHEEWNTCMNIGNDTTTNSSVPHVQYQVRNFKTGRIENHY